MLRIIVFGFLGTCIICCESASQNDDWRGKGFYRNPSQDNSQNSPLLHHSQNTQHQNAFGIKQGNYRLISESQPQSNNSPLKHQERNPFRSSYQQNTRRSNSFRTTRSPIQNQKNHNQLHQLRSSNSQNENQRVITEFSNFQGPNTNSYSQNAFGSQILGNSYSQKTENENSFASNQKPNETSLSHSQNAFGNHSQNLFRSRLNGVLQFKTVISNSRRVSESDSNFASAKAPPYPLLEPPYLPPVEEQATQPPKKIIISKYIPEPKPAPEVPPEKPDFNDSTIVPMFMLWTMWDFKPAMAVAVPPEDNHEPMPAPTPTTKIMTTPLTISRATMPSSTLTSTTSTTPSTITTSTTPPTTTASTRPSTTTTSTTPSTTTTSATPSTTTTSATPLTTTTSTTPEPIDPLLKLLTSLNFKPSLAKAVPPEEEDEPTPAPTPTTKIMTTPLTTSRETMPSSNLTTATFTTPSTTTRSTTPATTITTSTTPSTTTTSTRPSTTTTSTTPSTTTTSTTPDPIYPLSIHRQRLSIKPSLAKEVPPEEEDETTPPRGWISGSGPRTKIVKTSLTTSRATMATSNLTTATFTTKPTTPSTTTPKYRLAKVTTTSKTVTTPATTPPSPPFTIPFRIASEYLSSKRPPYFYPQPKYPPRVPELPPPILTPKTLNDKNPPGCNCDSSSIDQRSSDDNPCTPNIQISTKPYAGSYHADGRSEHRLDVAKEPMVYLDIHVGNTDLNLEISGGSRTDVVISDGCDTCCGHKSRTDDTTHEDFYRNRRGVLPQSDSLDSTQSDFSQNAFKIQNLIFNNLNVSNADEGPE